MDRFLFTDGTNGVREAHSKEELLALIHSAANPGNCRIWIFNSHEWTEYPSFQLQHPVFARETPLPETATASPRSRAKRGTRWLQKTFFLFALLAGTMLVFNFTSAGWEPVTPLITETPRPANVPVMDVDSLIGKIETSRGRLLDKSTRNNLRLRNNWPDFIFLRLRAEKELKGQAARYINIELSIDNASGFPLDQVIVHFTGWNKGRATGPDTLRFDNLAYGTMKSRKLNLVFRCDSISASFQSIRAKAFNFCYSDRMENPSGNYNDRWFCRDGKISQ